jgi:hypothetical protein
MGVTYGVVCFRTGVWNFVGAGLGFWGSTLTVKCQHRWLLTGFMWNTSEHVCWLVRTPLTATCEPCVSVRPSVRILGSWFALREVYFGILGCFGWSHFGMFSSRGWSLFIFLLSFLLFFLFLFFGSVEPQGVCWDIRGLVSLAMPQQIDTNTNCTVRASHPVHTLPFAMSFIWLSGSSVHTGAFTPTPHTAGRKPVVLALGLSAILRRPILTVKQKKFSYRSTNHCSNISPAIWWFCGEHFSLDIEHASEYNVCEWRSCNSEANGPEKGKLLFQACKFSNSFQFWNLKGRGISGMTFCQDTSRQSLYRMVQWHTLAYMRATLNLFK